MRDERYLRVLKLRGTGYVEGQHGFRISSGGLRVFPRLVSPVLPPTYQPAVERVSTGVVGLDQMLHGGLIAGNALLVAGPTGSGKTTLALQFALAGVRRGEPVLFINFQENPSQLVRHLRSLGASESDIASFGFQYVSPVELQIDSILVSVFKTVTERGIRRVAIDAIGDLEHAAADVQRLQNYLYAFVQHMTVRGVTSVMTQEVATVLVAARRDNSRLSAFCDALIVLEIEYGADPHRTIRVIKARGLDHPLEARRVHLGADGLRVSS